MQLGRKIKRQEINRTTKENEDLTTEEKKSSRRNIPKYIRTDTEERLKKQSRNYSLKSEITEVKDELNIQTPFVYNRKGNKNK